MQTCWKELSAVAPWSNCLAPNSYPVFTSASSQPRVCPFRFLVCFQCASSILSAPTMFNLREHHILMVSPGSHWCQLKSHSSRASVAATGTVVACQQDTNTTLLSKDFLQPNWSPLTTRHCPSCEQPDFYRTPPWTVPTCARPRCHLTEGGGQMSTTFGFLVAMSVPVR